MLSHPRPRLSCSSPLHRPFSGSTPNTSHALPSWRTAYHEPPLQIMSTFDGFIHGQYVLPSSVQSTNICPQNSPTSQSTIFGLLCALAPRWPASCPMCTLITCTVLSLCAHLSSFAHLPQKRYVITIINTLVRALFPAFFVCIFTLSPRVSPPPHLQKICEPNLRHHPQPLWLGSTCLAFLALHHHYCCGLTRPTSMSQKGKSLITRLLPLQALDDTLTVH